MWEYHPYESRPTGFNAMKIFGGHGFKGFASSLTTSIIASKCQIQFTKTNDILVIIGQFTTLPSSVNNVVINQTAHGLAASRNTIIHPCYFPRLLGQVKLFSLRSKLLRKVRKLRFSVLATTEIIKKCWIFFAHTLSYKLMLFRFLKQGRILLLNCCGPNFVYQHFKVSRTMFHLHSNFNVLHKKKQLSSSILLITY